MVPDHKGELFVREISPEELLLRLFERLLLSDNWGMERFDRGMESRFSLGLWTGTAPTRKGNAARATVMEKYIYKIEGVTR